MQPKAIDKRWIVAILVIIMTLRIVSYFMLSESVMITRSIKIGLRIILSAYCVLLYLKERKFQSSTGFKTVAGLPIFFYLAYLALGISSLLWSSAAGYSALQLIMDIECVIFVHYFWKLLLLWQNRISTETPLLLIGRVLGVATGIITVVFLIGMNIDPDTFYRSTHGGEIARLGGFIINPNELGMLLVIGCAGMYIDGFKHRFNIWKMVLITLMAYALFLTGSRSSLGSFVLVSGIFIMSLGNLRLRLGLVLGGVAATPVILKEVIFKQGNVEEVMSMTGRLPFWSDLLTYGFPQEPFLGFGFMRIAYADKFASLHAYDGAMTHNTFLQVLLNLGLIGACIVFLQMLFTFHAVIQEKSIWVKRTFIGLFIPLFINSLTEFGIFGETNYGIMFYLICLYMISIKIDNKYVAHA
ncbi:MAG: O-antigen ligase family protein [Bacteroidia bacterium]